MNWNLYDAIYVVCMLKLKVVLNVPLGFLARFQKKVKDFYKYVKW